MITEQYVTFETARMLKEAEFGEVCHSFYEESSGTAWDMTERSSMMSGWLPRPTQALASRWLREEHHISILITPLLDGWMVDLFDLKKYQYILCNKDTMADTYEEALEDGLQEALQVIIKRKEARND